MSNSKLPERASLEYLKKLAKDRLRELRQVDPRAKLATALLSVARDHGFSSWRALKAEVERRQTQNTAVFFEACARGDVEALRGLLMNDPSLVRARSANRLGGTGLHVAAGRGYVDAVRLLLEHGADPNARDEGDNAYPLHFAAASGHLETVRALVEAGADVHGTGDVHKGDVIGWAAREGNEAVVKLLLERGARHHIFSAIALRDLDLVERLVEENPECLSHRRSRFENEQTPLHAALAPPDGLSGTAPQYPMLELLIELGADVEAKDDKGRTPLEMAMLRGDREAMRLLKAAGAEEPRRVAPGNFHESMARLAGSIKKGVMSINVPDIAATLEWYTSIGFKEVGRYEDGGEVNWGMVTFGNAELMLGMQGKRGRQDVSLWFYTDKVDELYQVLKSRQFEAAQAALAGEPGEHRGIDFEEDLYNPFYGGRQFSIRDLNGYSLIFYQD
jgi:ankyrin repeat protein/catechol 2,3-dioxygenase-like lactoylglutathione lyase family enzyme